MDQPNTGALNLRPMGIGDILDTTLRLYKRNFASFLSIALITYVPYAIVMFLLHMAFDGESQINRTPYGDYEMPGDGEYVINLLGFVILFLFVYPLTTGALTYAISGTFLGQPLGAGAAYSRAAGRAGALIGTQFLVTLVVLLGFLLLVVPGIIFSLWFMIVPTVVLLEKIGGPSALGRAKALMKGNVGKGFALNLVVGLLVTVITYAVMFGIGYVVGMIGLPAAIIDLAANLLSAFFLPVQLAVIVLLYYDLRIRKEAFDLQMLSASLPGGEPSTA